VTWRYSIKRSTATVRLPWRLAPAKDHALAVLSNRISGYVSGASFLIDGGLSLTNGFDPPQLDLP